VHFGLQEILRSRESYFHFLAAIPALRCLESRFQGQAFQLQFLPAHFLLLQALQVRCPGVYFRWAQASHDLLSSVDFLQA
jgi:hypothetical protein